jgi:hypothetical protein
MNQLAHCKTVPRQESIPEAGFKRHSAARLAIRSFRIARPLAHLVTVMPLMPMLTVLCRLPYHPSADLVTFFTKSALSPWVGLSSTTRGTR